MTRIISARGVQLTIEQIVDDAPISECPGCPETPAYNVYGPAGQALFGLCPTHGGRVWKRGQDIPRDEE